MKQHLRILFSPILHYFSSAQVHIHQNQVKSCNNISSLCLKKKKEEDYASQCIWNEKHNIYKTFQVKKLKVRRVKFVKKKKKYI